MNKQQQIEEMARDLPFLTLERDVHISSTNVEKRAWTLSEEDNKIIAEALYNAGYRKTFTSDFASDTQKAYKEGYIKGIEETEAEMERLKAQLSEFEKPVTQFVKDRETQAVKEFAEKLKKEVYPFLQAKMYDKKHFICGTTIADKELENQNIGILKAQDVLSQWFNIKIDELLKEYEE